MTSKQWGTAFPALVLFLVRAAASRVKAQYSVGIPLGYPPVSPFGPGYGFGAGLGYGIYGTGGIEMGLGFPSFATANYEMDFGSSGSLTDNALGDFAGSLTVATAWATPSRRQQGTGPPSRSNRTTMPSGRRPAGITPMARFAKPRPDKPREHVLDDDGKILWPGATPDDSAVAGARQLAEVAVQAVVREGKSAGYDSIRQVADARNKLVGFSKKAMPEVRAQNAADAAGLETFIFELGQTLETMAVKY
jgi:hypothetical protein